VTHENAVDDIESKERWIKRRREQKCIFFCVGKCEKKNYFTREGERETERSVDTETWEWYACGLKKIKKIKIKMWGSEKKLRIRQNINKKMYNVK